MVGEAAKRVSWRAAQHTCSSCRKHRPCEPLPEGRWQCRLCREVGVVSCGICGAAMPAGKGKRCDNCYWLERCRLVASELGERVESHRAREAFAAYAAWLPSQGSVNKAATRLRAHVAFFQLLGAAGEPWTGEVLLRHFGPATLRKYELPMRWLRAEHGVASSPVDRAREADARRVRSAISVMPEGSVGRELLDAFQAELAGRRDAGLLTERSMRLAFRPALVLLALEDAGGARAPSQATLELYLARTPGQRAALSTFVGFLRASRGIDVHIPRKGVAVG